MKTILEVENLRVRFRTMSNLQARLKRVKDPLIDAVRDASFSITEAQTFTLVGESGSGKSTLALAVAGLLPTHEGSIQFFGDEVTTMTDGEKQAYQRSISFVWQNPTGSLSPRQSVGKIITEPFIIHGKTDLDLNAEAIRLLNLVGLPEHFKSLSSST